MNNPSEFSDAIAKKVCEEGGLETDNVTAENALHFALQITHKPVFLALLAAGANVNDVSEGETPLHIAVRKNFLEAVTLLLEKGANVDKNGSINYDNENLFGGWLNNNAQFDTDYTKYRYTSLHFASSRNNIEIVKLLLNFRANVNVVDKNKWSPLHLASDLGHIEVVKLLLDNKANVNARCNPKIIINIDNNPFQPRGTEYSGRTSLHLAALCNRKDVMDILLNKGADIDAPDYDSWTALHIACFYGHFEIAQLLLDRGANIEAEGHERWRPLHEACSQGKTEIVKLLVRRGANIEATKTWGDTPLHWAIWHGHLDTVKALVELGANIFVWDTKGDSAIGKAQMKDFPDITSYLLEHAQRFI